MGAAFEHPTPTLHSSGTPQKRSDHQACVDVTEKFISNESAVQKMAWDFPRHYLIHCA